MATSVVGRMAAVLSLDAKSFTSGLDAAQSQLARFSTAMASFGRSASVRVTAPLVALGTSALKVASDAQEASSKFNAVFGESAAAVREWSQETAKATRSSSLEIQKFAARTGQTLKTLGVEGTTELSKSIVKLGIDLADFNQINQSEAIEALNKALLGSARAARIFDVALTPAKVNSELLARGIAGGTKAATDAQKAHARLAIILRETSAAQGEAERSANSLDNILQGLSKAAKDIAGSFGEVMLPAAQAIGKQALELADGFRNLDEGTRKLVSSLLLVAASAGPAALAISAVARAVQSLIAASALLAAHPLGLALGAIALAAGGLVAAVGVLERKWREHTAAVQDARKATDELKISLEDLLSVSQKGLPKGVGVDAAIAAIRGEIAAAEKALNPPGGRGNLLPGFEEALRERISRLEAGLRDLETQKTLAGLAESTRGLFAPTKPAVAGTPRVTAKAVPEAVAQSTTAIREQEQALAELNSRFQALQDGIVRVELGDFQADLQIGRREIEAVAKTALGSAQAARVMGDAFESEFTRFHEAQGLADLESFVSGLERDAAAVDLSPLQQELLDTKARFEEMAAASKLTGPEIDALRARLEAAVLSTGRVAEEAMRVSVNIGSAISGALRGTLSSLAEGTFSGEELLRRFRDAGLGLVEDFFGQVLEQKLNFDSFWEKNWLSELPGVVAEGAGAMAKAFGSFIDFAIDGVIKLVEWLIEAVNWQTILNALSSVGSGIGGIVTGVLGLIPGLQHGGVVTRPTPALVGEAGPEAVIPLEELGAMGGGEQNVEVNVYSPTPARVQRGRNAGGDPQINVYIEDVVANSLLTGGRVARAMDQSRGTRQIGSVR